MVPSNSPLRRFREHLQQIEAGDGRQRPFICDGSPFDCQVFLVGVKPASLVPMWEFWSDDVGLDKAAWLNCYRSLRANEPPKLGHGSRQPVSPTRQRIELFAHAAEPVKVLETYLYGFPTPAERDLRKPDRDIRAFEFLLAEIKPNVLVLYGEALRDHFGRRYGCSPNPQPTRIIIEGGPVFVAAVQHFSILPVQAAIQLGREVRSLCSIVDAPLRGDSQDGLGVNLDG